METIELVKAGKVLTAVVAKAEEAGFKVVKSDGPSVTVKAGCLPVAISWEMCSCHGGRMWLSQGETGVHIELSSDGYDESKGITDPETELAYYIDNSMEEEVRGFERYVYVIETEGRYADGKREARYFKSIEEASAFVFEEPGHDLMSEYGTVTHQYPNPNMRLRITYRREDGGRLFFEGEFLSRKDGKSDFEVDRRYEIMFRVFRKR